MGSTRLPNKVMKEVLGKPLIAYLLERVSTSKHIGEIIVATTTNSEDDILSKYVSSLGYHVFRGSENDVLSRYYNAYLTLNLKENINGIIRITGDCPLFESDICDELIEFYNKEKADHVYLSPKFAEGLDCDIFSPKLLKLAFDNAMLPSEREHVTLYFNKLDIKQLLLDNSRDDSKYRLTIDEPEDYIVIKSIIENLENLNKKLTFNNVKSFLDSNPDVFKINSRIIRNEGLIKSIEEESN